jgi:glycosyltransferase involved in cell wall biosynthesis
MKNNFSSYADSRLKEQGQRTLFIGNIQYGQASTAGGVQTKNQIFLDFLKNQFLKVRFYDTYNKNKIAALLKTLWEIIIINQQRIILSISFLSAYGIIKIISIFKIRRHIVWFMAGDSSDAITEKHVKALSLFNKICVQSDYIKRKLNATGLKNIIVVPNFKNIYYIPDKKVSDSDIVKFVFFSRLIKEKGVDTIIEVAKQLRTDDYEIDFYGSLNKPYTKQYFEELKLPNVRYKEFLDIRKQESYDILSGYDVMLIPTFFEGESLPGVLIDAFIAGLPVIATDFHANPDVIIDGENGILIPVNNIHALKEAMGGFISKRYDLVKMSKCARASAMKYDVKIVLTDGLFEELWT